MEFYTIKNNLRKLKKRERKRETRRNASTDYKTIFLLTETLETNSENLEIYLLKLFNPFKETIYSKSLESSSGSSL